MQLQVPDLKARIARLEELAKGLAKEVGLQRGDDGVLLSRECKQYLRAIQEALVGADEGCVVLAGVVKRLRAGRLGKPSRHRGTAQCSNSSNVGPGTAGQP